MFFFGDVTWIFLIPALIFVMWAQYRVKATFNEYSRVGVRRGLTGAQVARSILDGAGLHDVRVERVAGHLSDHYDPRDKVVRLSDAVHSSQSVAALGVAAHEVGHAMQHDHGYMPLVVRNTFVPVANIGSAGGPWLFIIGLIFGGSTGGLMMDLGILFFAAAVFFYIVTLPVEFNASSRALAVLGGTGYLEQDELRGARAVLWAAAMTYVAAAAMAISQLLRLLVLRGMARD